MRGLRCCAALASAVLLYTAQAHAGVSVEAGATFVQPSTADSTGGGTSVGAAWWFRRNFAATFANKEAYTVDNDVISFFAVGVATVQPVGPVGLRLGASIVHQHHESLDRIKDQPFGALFGVGTGIHHSAGGRLALDVIVPLRRLGKADQHQLFVAVGADATVYGDALHGRWMWATTVDLGIMFNGAAVPR